jgi:hypothetical protein
MCYDRWAAASFLNCHCHVELSARPSTGASRLAPTYRPFPSLHSHATRASGPRLYAAGTDTERETATEESSAQDDEEVPLSDVDARVLQSILRDEKVDTKTEEGIRKLLERGTVKRAPTGGGSAFDERDDDDASEFSSTVVKTLTNTKLWRKVSAQANDLLETVSIWVQNKIEQDVKVLAALGLFAWERAVRDVARALPEAGQTSRTVMLLGNSSSYREPQPESLDSVRRRMEAMNKPSEEIREVTRTIWEILAGERRTEQGRALRTVAPAGTANSGERIRRAYRQRKLMERQSRDVTRIPGAVVDTAYELRQELTAEASVPGYKTAGIRNAIGASVAETNRLLNEVKEGARLAAAKKKALRLQAARATAKSIREDIVEGLRLERMAIAQRLRLCIKAPENTWLREDVILASEKQVQFDQDGLRDVVTNMMLVRDEIELKGDDDQPFEDLLEDLAAIRRSLESVRGRIAAATSYSIADAYWDVVSGAHDSDDDVAPLLLRLDEIQELMSGTAEIEASENVYEAGASAAPFFSTTENGDDVGAVGVPGNDGSRVFDFVDVVPEAVFRREPDHEHRGGASSGLEEEAIEFGMIAELVSDEDFDVAVGVPRTMVDVGDAADDERPNELGQLSLRVLDVAFFVFEKTFTVVLPKSYVIVQTAARRLAEVREGGKGSTGWKPVRNAADAKGRY